MEILVKIVQCYISGKGFLGSLDRHEPRWTKIKIWKNVLAGYQIFPVSTNFASFFAQIVFPAKPAACGQPWVHGVRRAQPQGACEFGVQTSLGGSQKICTTTTTKTPPQSWALDFIFSHFWSFSAKCQFWNSFWKLLRTFTHFNLLGMIYVTHLSSFDSTTDTSKLVQQYRWSEVLPSYNALYESLGFA